MSRRRNALVATFLGYAQSFLSIAASFYITRLLVRVLGTDLYGTWLATGGVIAYAALADLGIFNVMPWLFAEADGEKNRARTKSLIAHGLLAGLCVGGAYLLLALLLLVVLPKLVHVNASELGRLRGPINIVICATAVTYPLRLFSALRNGLQDFKFVGSWQVVGVVLNASLCYALLRAGGGLYAVAIASSIPTLLVGAASLARTARLTGDLLRDLPTPTFKEMRPILSSGAGSWMASLGWQLAFATDAIVIAYLGHRELVPRFVITSRLGLTLMQFAWSLPDSATIGLAQLGAEGNRKKTSETVATLIRLHLLPIGAIACAVLAVNATFVGLWVGPAMYGGSWLNALFALDVIVLTVVHALVMPASALGSRVQVGTLTLANGLLHIVLALIAGRFLGLAGVALATTLSAFFTTLPGGLRLLAQRADLPPLTCFRAVIWPWLMRLFPCASLALLAGWAANHLRGTSSNRIGLLMLALGAGGFSVVTYLWGVRSITRTLPFGSRLFRLLSAVRLV